MDDDVVASTDGGARCLLDTRASPTVDEVSMDPAMSRDRLEEAYVEAWAQWESSGQRDVWDSTVADGLTD